jgi:hypothetical protein
MTMKHLLDNITRHTLAGPHAKYAAGAEDVRRYAQGFSPILGFADPGRPNFATLARFCEPGEHFYSEGWSGATPAGWRIDAESTMFKMIWEAQMPATDEAPDAVPLGPEHAAQALELATLTRPGPFGLRTIRLGGTSATDGSAWWPWPASACAPDAARSGVCVSGFSGAVLRAN